MKQGDSGGPLNWEDLREDSSKEGTKYVIGIVSWGQGCARASFPGNFISHSWNYGIIDGHVIKLLSFLCRGIHSNYKVFRMDSPEHPRLLLLQQSLERRL